MKWCFLAIFFLILLSVGIVVWKLFPSNPYPGYKVVNYKLENRTLKLLIADTPKKWEVGLMNYTSLKNIDGMIFLFPDEDYRNFWNMNTFMDLDIYWIDKGKVIGKSFLPSIYKSKNTVTMPSPGKADTVIELPKTNE